VGGDVGNFLPEEVETAVLAIVPHCDMLSEFGPKRLQLLRDVVPGRRG
jgi:hypothetical protein